MLRSLLDMGSSERRVSHLANGITSPTPYAIQTARSRITVGIIEMLDYDALQSGDLLLFSGTSCLSCCIQCLSCSSFSHIGLILRNPIWLPPGLYLLESTKITHIPDVEQHGMQSGVQIHLLHDVVAECKKDGTILSVRHLTITRDNLFQEKLKTIHDAVHAKPYDLNLYDWVCAEYNLMHTIPVDASHQERNQFWCSALVAYVYCQLGVLSTDLNWSIIAPKSFCTNGSLPFLLPVSGETAFL